MLVDKRGDGSSVYKPLSTNTAGLTEAAGVIVGRERRRRRRRRRRRLVVGDTGKRIMQIPP